MKKPFLYCSGSQGWVPEPSVTASPGNLLEMCILLPRARPTASETLGVRPSLLCFTSSQVIPMHLKIWEPLLSSFSNLSLGSMCPTHFYLSWRSFFCWHFFLLQWNLSEWRVVFLLNFHCWYLSSVELLNPGVDLGKSRVTCVDLGWGGPRLLFVCYGACHQNQPLA